MEDSTFHVLLTLLSLLLLYTFRQITSKKSNKNLPPSPAALPIIGHFHHFKIPLYRSLSDLSQKYGPVMFLQLGCRPVVMVSSFSLAEECFMKNDIVLANRPRFFVGQYFSYSYTTLIAASYGDHWRNLRRITSVEIFSLHRLDVLSDIRRDEIQRLMQKLGLFSRDASSSRDFVSVELRTPFTELTFIIMMSMVAGKRYYGEDLKEGEEEEASEFREITRKIVQLVGVPYPGDLLPVLKWIDYGGVKKKVVEIVRKADSFMQRLVDENRRRKGDPRSPTPC